MFNIIRIQSMGMVSGVYGDRRGTWRVMVGRTAVKRPLRTPKLKRRNG
jgi:hypothetical protein